MTINSLVSRSSTTSQPIVGETPARPVGVTVIAAGFAFGAIFVVVKQLQTLAKIQTVGESLPVLRIVAAILLCSVFVASAFGIWRGKKWVWWCLSCFFALAIVRHVLLLLWALLVVIGFIDSTHEPDVLMHFRSFLMRTFILGYLHQSHVLEFFGLRAFFESLES